MFKLLMISLVCVSSVLAEPAEFYIVQPISNIIRTPFSASEDGIKSNQIELIAARGEYEPASFVVHAVEPLENVILAAGPLSGKDSVIEAKNVDIKIVKCWYQAGTAWQNVHAMPKIRTLVPELLLKDDSLVKVDYQKKINYVKFRFSTGDKYIDMSQPFSQKQPSMNLAESPIRDTKTLQPFNIPQKQYKQIWITFHIPPETRPGAYNGKIKVIANGQGIGYLDVKLLVLPFELPPPVTHYNIKKRYVSSIYYKGILDAGQASLSGWFKNQQQLCADLENMVAHGVTSPTMHQLECDPNMDNFTKVLQIRKKCGINDTTLYLLGKERNLGFGNSQKPEDIAKAVNYFTQIKSIAEANGVKQLYVYAIDEATGNLASSQKTIWRALQKAGARIWVSGYMFRIPTAFVLYGDVLDLFVSCGNIEKSIASQWHSKGHDVWSYGNPQGGVEDPLAYRRNYGLAIWTCDYDGAATYVYHHGYGHSWNDFDDQKWRDHNLTYPTTDGVVDTIAWEGYREGIDDIRYATLLKQRIAIVLINGDPKCKKIAKDADEWLESVDISRRNLDTVRIQMIRWILRLEREMK